MTGVEGAAVGFVGLGTMGNPMALNLVRAGCHVTVNDVRRDTAANLVEEGATWADNPTAVAEVSEVTFLSLPTPADVEAVVTGTGGMLAGAPPGSVIVDNLLFLNGVLTSVEAMVTAAKAGVDLGVLREVVQAGSGGSFVWEYATKAIGRDRLGPTSSVAPATKDADLAVRMAQEVGAAAPSATYVRDRLLHYRDNGFAADDVLGIVKAFEEAAGTVVRGVASESAP